MRWLQAFLLVLGSAILGTTLGFFGLVFAVASLLDPGGELWRPGFGQTLGGLFCGAPVGASIGIALSLAWVCSREEAPIWNRAVWAGVVLGVAAGTFFTFLFGVHGMEWWATSIVVVDFATIGGILAGVFSEALRRD